MSRLFNSEGMTTDKWKLISPTEVLIADIRPSQSYVSIQALIDLHLNQWFNQRDIYPHIVKQDDIWWLEDGHHRYVRALLRDQLMLTCRVLDNDASTIEQEVRAMSNIR